MDKSKYEHLPDEYAKIVGIYARLDDLCESIEEQVDAFDKQLQTISVFQQNQKSTKDLSKQSGEFLWLQAFHHIINRLPKNPKGKQDLIEICRSYYRGNIKELKLIDEFERDYRSEEAIRWYSKESFVYKLINKALRTEDIDQLYTFRFFIADLSQSLNQEHNKILVSDEKILTVYRGAILDKEEFDKLEENEGKLISTSGYLSTSRLRSAALPFANKRTKRLDIQHVLFEINCDVQGIGKTITFADIDQFSEYRNKEEVLFDLNTCFTIESIEQNDSFQLIKMNVSNEGYKITENFLTEIQDSSEVVSTSIIFGILMTNVGKYSKAQNYFQQLLIEPDGDDIAWIEFWMGWAYYCNGQWTKAREHYDHAYNRMIEAEPARENDSAKVLNNIGLILCDQGECDKALDCHQRALKIREELDPSNQDAICESLANIGLTLCRQGKYDDALDYCKIALEIHERLYPYDNLPDAIILNNIGEILYNQGKYDESLGYYQRASRMGQALYPSEHVNIAVIFNNIGRILHERGKYDEAIDYYRRALNMLEKLYPLDHPSIGESLLLMGACYRNQNRRTEALDCYHRASTIFEKWYDVGHSGRELVDLNTQQLTEKNCTRL